MNFVKGIFHGKNHLNDPPCRRSDTARLSAETPRNLLRRIPSSNKSAAVVTERSRDAVSASGGRFLGLFGSYYFKLPVLPANSSHAHNQSTPPPRWGNSPIYIGFLMFSSSAHYTDVMRFSEDREDSVRSKEKAS